MKRALAAAVMSMVFGACAPAPTPPVSAALSPLPPKPSSSAAQAPSLSLLGDPEKPPPPAPPSPKVAAFDRALTPVPLPEGVHTLTAIDGRSASDLWMLAAEGSKVDVLRWDGAALKREKPPVCPYGVQYSRLVVGPSGPIATGDYDEIGGPQFVESHRSSKGSTSVWSCDKRIAAQILPLSTSLLRFHERRTLALDGLAMPLPDLRDIAWSKGVVRGRSAADLWLFFPGHREIYHWNGVAWDSRPPPVPFVSALAVDPSGVAWVTGGHDERGDGDSVFRWDHEGRAWAQIPAPSDLGASLIVAAGARDVWLLGKESIHRWDGAALHRGPMSHLYVKSAWASPEGEVWLAGEDRQFKGKGAVVRAEAPKAP